jgi:hypothetical protein
MKNVVLIFVLFIGIVSGLKAQGCQPCPANAVCPKNACVTACNSLGASASSVSSIDFVSMFAAEINPACQGVASANNPACKPTCVAATMPASQGAVKAVSNESKACQPACSAAKPSCQPCPGKTATAAEKTIDQQYHQVPKPIKS